MDPNKEQPNTGAPQPRVEPSIPPTPPTGMPDAPTPSAPDGGVQPPKGSKKPLVLLGVVALVAIVVAVIAYFVT